MQGEIFDIAWTTRAGKDIDQIFEWLENHVSRSFAQQTAIEIYSATNILETMPERFPKDKNVRKPMRNIRRILVGAYRIVYEFTGQSVIILRVLHSRRDLKKFLKKV